MISASARTPATTASHGKLVSSELVAVVDGAAVVGVGLVVAVVAGAVVGEAVVDVFGTVVTVVEGAGVVVVWPDAAAAWTTSALTTSAIDTPRNNLARWCEVRALCPPRSKPVRIRTGL
jgi:hypothetical protein